MTTRAVKHASPLPVVSSDAIYIKTTVNLLPRKQIDHKQVALRRVPAMFSAIIPLSCR